MNPYQRQYAKHNEARICTCYSCLTYRVEVGAPIHTDAANLANMVARAESHPLPY